MITQQRLDNLLSYYILFWHDMRNNIDGILESHPSYILEKYDIFFDNPPDKIININEERENHTYLFELAELGLNRWGIKFDEFIQHPDFMKYYFTFYLVHSEKEKKSDGSHGVFSKIIPIYKRFFTDYDGISNENGIFTLHELMKRYHARVKGEYKQLYRTVLIKSLIK